MRFRRRSRGFRRKRSVSWIPGGVFGSAARKADVTVTLSPLAAPSATTAATFFITVATDLFSAGGEDAVIQRILFDLWFQDLRYDSTSAVIGFLKFVVWQAQSEEQGGTVFTPDFYQSPNQGIDAILFERDILVLGSGDPGNGGQNQISHLAVDVKATRKVTEASPIVFGFFGAPKSAAGAAPTSVNVAGYYRALMKHAR